MFFSFILICIEENELNFFYNNYGIRTVIVCFNCVIIDLIKEHKNHENIYFHNTRLW